MAFRVYSVMVALVALSLASNAGAQGVISSTSADGTEPEMLYPTCHVISEDDPKTFETLYVPADDLTSESNGDLEGPCTEWLGQLCDDGLKCTIDYDYELVECIPMADRKAVSGCTEVQ